MSRKKKALSDLAVHIAESASGFESISDDSSILVIVSDEDGAAVVTQTEDGYQLYRGVTSLIKFIFDVCGEEAIEDLEKFMDNMKRGLCDCIINEEDDAPPKELKELFERLAKKDDKGEGDA